MNLQVCIPYQKCPFGCPMCIASNPKHYTNLFKANQAAYLGGLGAAMSGHKYKDVVLTGDTDPTLNTDWLKQVTRFLTLLNFKYKVGIEIQTHNYSWKGLNGIIVNAFSVTTLKDAARIPSIRTRTDINRLVVLGTKELLRYFMENDVDLSEFKQLTLKALQHTASKVGTVDDYIDSVSCEEALLQQAAVKFKKLGLQVKIDLNCQDATGRYAIFREDGRLYNSWEE